MRAPPSKHGLNRRSRRWMATSLARSPRSRADRNRRLRYATTSPTTLSSSVLARLTSPRRSRSVSRYCINWSVPRSSTKAGRLRDGSAHRVPEPRRGSPVPRGRPHQVAPPRNESGVEAERFLESGAGLGTGVAQQRRPVEKSVGVLHPGEPVGGKSFGESFDRASISDAFSLSGASSMSRSPSGRSPTCRSRAFDRAVHLTVPPSKTYA